MNISADSASLNITRTVNRRLHTMSWDADNEPFDSKHQDDDPWVRSLDEAFVRKLAQARMEKHESRNSRNLRALQEKP